MLMLFHLISIYACFMYMTIFITNQQMWVTDENNRGIFQELQNIIMGKIKSIILGSSLITTLNSKYMIGLNKWHKINTVSVMIGLTLR